MDKKQVDKNYEKFKEQLPVLLEEHKGKFSLWHDGELVEVYDTSDDCMKIGMEKFGEGNFSYQEITDQPVDLGFLSVCR